MRVNIYERWFCDADVWKIGQSNYYGRKPIVAKRGDWSRVTQEQVEMQIL